MAVRISGHFVVLSTCDTMRTVYTTHSYCYPELVHCHKLQQVFTALSPSCMYCNYASQKASDRAAYWESGCAHIALNVAGREADLVENDLFD